MAHDQLVAGHVACDDAVARVTQLECIVSEAVQSRRGNDGNAAIGQSRTANKRLRFEWATILVEQMLRIARCKVAQSDHGVCPYR